MYFLRVILCKTASSLIHLADLRTRDESITIPHTRESLGSRSTPFRQGPGRTGGRGESLQFDTALLLLILWFEAFSLFQRAQAQRRAGPIHAECLTLGINCAYCCFLVAVLLGLTKILLTLHSPSIRRNSRVHHLPGACGHPQVTSL